MNPPTNEISKLLDGSVTAEEKVLVSEWRQASPENETHFQEMSYIWSVTHQEKLQEQKNLDIDTEAALVKVHQKMNEGKVVEMPVRRNYLAIACGLSVLIVAAFLLKQFMGETTMTQIIASADSGQSVILPDGSSVWMEPSTEIAYDKNFTEGRTIQVKGEVYVDVVRDESKPFIVNTPHLKVGVLGTSFVINDVAGGDQASVTVLSGKVSVTDVTSQNNVILTKDMTAEYKGQNASLNIAAESRDINHLYHATNELVFVNITLEEMINQLEKITDRKITLENAALKGCLFKGHFKTNDLEVILKNIQPIYNFNYISKNGVYTIADGYCNK